MANLLVATRASVSNPLLTLLDMRLIGVVLIALCIRFALHQNLMYGFLLWNLVLGYAPLIICRLHERFGGSRDWRMELVLFAIWLLFLPNAPYIVTDFVHPINALAAGRFEGLLLGTLATGGAAVLGLYWYVRALRYFDETLDGRGASEGLRASACGGVVMLSALGIWLGRLLRFNTWDVLTQPWTIVRDSGAFLSSATHLELVAVSSLLLWGVWRGYARYRWVGSCLR